MQLRGKESACLQEVWEVLSSGNFSSLVLFRVRGTSGLVHTPY